MLKVTYDKGIADKNDEYVLCAQEAIGGLSLTNTLGAYWMDYFPILRYLPSWFPGCQGKKIVEHYKSFIREMRDKPFDELQQYRVCRSESSWLLV